MQYQINAFLTWSTVNSEYEIPMQPLRFDNILGLWKKLYLNYKNNLHYPVIHGRLSRREERLNSSPTEFPQSDLVHNLTYALNCWGSTKGKTRMWKMPLVCKTSGHNINSSPSSLLIYSVIMWRLIGSSTQESEPWTDWLKRIPKPRAEPSLLKEINHVTDNNTTCH